jgi:hypothetical protein
MRIRASGVRARLVQQPATHALRRHGCHLPALRRVLAQQRMLVLAFVVGCRFQGRCRRIPQRRWQSFHPSHAGEGGLADSLCRRTRAAHWSRTALEGQKAPRHGKHKKAICRFVDFVLFALWRVPSASAHACGAEGNRRRDRQLHAYTLPIPPSRCSTCGVVRSALVLVALSWRDRAGATPSEVKRSTAGGGRAPHE